MKRKILLAAFLAVLGSAASAACTAPNINNGHTVMKFGNSGDGTGVIGTKSSVGTDNRQAGTVYYDPGTGSLRLCNGTQWVDALGGTSGTTPTGMLKPGQWHKKWWSSTTNLAPYHLKVFDGGNYKWRLDVARVNENCEFYIHEGGGVKRKIFWVRNSDNKVGGARVVWSIYGLGGGQYRFFVDSFDADKRTSDHREYNGYQAKLYGANNADPNSKWHLSGSFVSKWNGKFSWTSAGSGCDARTIMLRVD